MALQNPKDLALLSVQERSQQLFKVEAPLVFRVANFADEIPTYGTPERDIALWKFWKTEPLLEGAIYAMVARTAALDVRLRGPRDTVKRLRRILMAADFGVGNGWINFVSKVVLDLLVQDNGAFIELLRAPGAGAVSRVRGIAHLDSQRCERTGSLLWPVRYQPSQGNPKELAWYEVVPMADMPSTREEDKGRGYCAVSRVLRAAQTMRDIGIYKRQKLAGKRTPAFLFVQGVTQDRIEAAMSFALEEQISEGLTHYTTPQIIAAMDAAVPLDAKLVELAGLPDGYNEDDAFKTYIATLALGFGTDYTDLAPLPGGNLGSATQATEMAARARGKGPGLLLQQIEFALNYWVLPEDTEFQFASSDPIAERERIEQAKQRAQERDIRIGSGEITTEQALRLAIDAGDAPAAFMEPGADTVDAKIDTVLKSIGDLEASMTKVHRVLTRMV